MSDYRRMSWFAFYRGRSWLLDIWGEARAAFLVRRDLLGPGDEGMAIPIAVEIGIICGPTAEDMMDGRWWNWRFRPWLRTDAGEIGPDLWSKCTKLPRVRRWALVRLEKIPSGFWSRP